MTGKEALEQIMEKYTFYVPARSEGKEHLLNCLNIVAKDLERLEKLEEEYQKLEAQNNKENIRLLYNQSYLIAKVEKLKQALDILKIKLKLYFSKNTKGATINAILPIGVNDLNNLTQNEYEILKEVFGNES